MGKGMTTAVKHHDNTHVGDADDKHVDVLLITDAPENPEAQFKHRRRQYLWMMALRIVCLIAAAVLVGLDVPYAGWWAAGCIAGMIILPWAAVLVANDGPPRKQARGRVSRLLHSRRAALPGGRGK